MCALLLDSLEIRGFQAFRHLRVERLGRVNLIVGKNNVGKTSLLEAVWLYGLNGSSEVIWEILEARDVAGRVFVNPPQIHGNILLPGTHVEGSFAATVASEVRHLFHGRPDIRGLVDRIQIGTLSGPKLSITVGWYVEHTADGELPKPKLVPIEERSLVVSAFPALAIQKGNAPTLIQRLDRSGGERMWDESSKLECFFINSDGLNDSDSAGLWDQITLSESEQNVIDALNLLAPPVIERLNFVVNPDGERVAKVRVSGVNEPLPLRSLGDGMNRLLGVALALVNVREGLLLIDEVENGLHYSVQPDVWRLIFKTARDLNVQVFASTHSWDCIKAFQRAAKESDEEGLLIRLSEKQGEIIPTIFDERRLSIATQEEIEVR